MTTTDAHADDRWTRWRARSTGPAPVSFASLTREEARRALEIRPEPVAAVRRSGPGPYRILLFGGGLLRGTGLLDHELGLPGRIADDIVARRSRGVHLDVVVEAEPTSSRALAFLAGMRLRRYDAVVVFLGQPKDARTGDARQRAALVGLVKVLISETSASAGLFVYDSTRAAAPTAPDQRGSRVDAAARQVALGEEVCSLTARVRFAEVDEAVLPAGPTRGFADGSWRDWSAWMVDRLLPALRSVDRAIDDDSPRRYRDRPQAERLRQRAVGSLRLRRGDRDDVLDREVRQAKLMYGATSAALTIVDGDEVWSRATTDAEVLVLRRADAFCDIGVRSEGLLLINDTWLDPRTRDNPAHRGADAVRFYAGCPVRTWDGYRVGMVCVLGSEPRAFSGSEFGGLRDVASRVERLLWRSALGGGPTRWRP